MRLVFADSWYWIALANPRDEWHLAAKAIEHQFGPYRIVTTDEVLAEFLTFFSRRGEFWRGAAVRLVRLILSNANIQVLPQSRNSFLQGLNLDEQRPDKEYSHADCVSMEAMREHNLLEVLTHDHHFT